MRRLWVRRFRARFLPHWFPTSGFHWRTFPFWPAKRMIARRLDFSSALPAFRRSRDWPAGVTGLVRASLAFLDAEPSFARLLAVDVYSAGPEAVENLDRAIDLSLRFIEAGPDRPELDNPVAAEAIQSAIFATLSAQVKANPAGDLRDLAPLAIYLILAPFLGPEEAYRHAAG